MSTADRRTHTHCHCYVEPPEPPATYGCEVGRIEDEPVYLHLRSARPKGGARNDSWVEPVIDLTVMPFNTWQMVKRRIKEKWQGLKAVSDMNIRLLYKGVELRSGSYVNDYNLNGSTSDRPVELQYLVIDRGHDAGHKGSGNIGLYVDSQVPATAALAELVASSLAALLSGIHPRLSEEGTGATYMLRDTSNSEILGVFKPKDEEAFAPQNPRGYVGQENTTGLRQGVFSTQQASREVAAYLLDYGRFAGVPETTLVHGKHPAFVKVGGKSVWKIGAFQSFVQTKDTAGNFAAQVFGVADVHRIGILDIRIINLDRNDSNILVRHRRNSAHYELVPIDHGLSLPDRLEVYASELAWMSWPQARKPFGETELAYIRKLSGARDARLLSMCLGIRRECLRLMEVTTRLLQIGAEFGLTLFEIGAILYRADCDGDIPPQQSALDRIIESCLDAALVSTGQGAVTSSQTISGLDLQASRPLPGCRRLSRQTSAPVRQAFAGPQLTPLLGPVSPLAPVPGPSSEGEDIPPLTVPGAFSEHGVLGSPAGTPPSPGRQADREVKASHTDHRFGAGRTPRQYRNDSRKRRRRGSSLLTRPEGEGQDAQGSIFARPDLQSSDWSPELETAFKRHVTAALTEYVRKNFYNRMSHNLVASDEKPPASEAAISAEGGAAQEEPNTSLASALPLVLPPHSRTLSGRTLSAASSPPQDEGDPPSPGSPAGAAATDPPAQSEAAPPQRPLYVPPQRRVERALHPKVAAPRSGGEPADEQAGAREDAATTKLSTPVSSTAPAAAPEETSGGDSRHGFCTHQGPRGSMEDAVDVIKPFGADGSPMEFYAVYDGHGGTPAVEFVKRRLPAAIRACGGFGDPSRFNETLHEAFAVTDEELLKRLRQDQPTHIARNAAAAKTTDNPYILSSGCVACVAIVCGATVCVAHVGDCRALLCCGGDIKPLTVDHRPRGNHGERERLRELGIEVDSDGYLHERIEVSRAFGGWAWYAEEKCSGLLCSPEVSEVELAPDTEFLLLACDGVFEKMTAKEAGQIVRRHLRASGDAKSAAEALVRHATHRNSTDNLSAIVVLFSLPPRQEERTAPRLFMPAGARSRPA